MTLAPCHACGRESEPLSLYCERRDDAPTREGARLVTMLLVVTGAVVCIAAAVALRSCS